MFAMADGSQLAYIKEATWGTTPATPAWQIMRLTGESLKVTRETKTSAEITPERDVMDHIQVAGGAAGGFNFELSYGAYDAILESLMYNEWETNVLKNGVLQVPLSFEKKLLIGEDTYSYLRYTGMIANSMSLNVSANDVITGSFDFLGKGGSVAAAAIASSTYLDATTEDVINATSHIGALTFGSFTSPKILSVSLNVSNNLMTAPVLGSLDSGDIGAGRFDVSGSIEVYFQNSDIYAAFLAATASSLTMTLGATTGKKYTIALPKIKFSDAEIYASAQNSYVMCSVPFQAIYDSVSECTMQITRAVA